MHDNNQKNFGLPELGHRTWRSQPPFQNLDEFLTLSEPPKKTTQRARARRASEDSDVAPDNPDGTPRKPRCTRIEKLRRLKVIAKWLEESATMALIIASAKTCFGIGRRSAQLYVKEVKRQWAEAASKEDYLAHLWQSKVQHEELIHRAFRALDKLDDPNKTATMLRAAQGLLKNRDQVMAQVQLHRRWAKRDQSVDSLRERSKRSGMVIMPLGELEERYDNIRHAWRREFEIEFCELNNLGPAIPPECGPGSTHVTYPDGRRVPRSAGVVPIPESPPPGWGQEWQRRRDEQKRAELKEEHGIGD